MPAGDQRDAVAAARQQLADLGGVADVVEDDEQAEPVGQRAEQGRRTGDGLRDPAGCDAEREQELAQDFEGGRLTCVAEPAQVGVEPPVREGRGGAARPVQRQRGLAHPGRPGDQTDGRLACRGPRDRGEFGAPSVEAAGSAGQQIGGVRVRRGGGARRGRDVRGAGRRGGRFREYRGGCGTVVAPGCAVGRGSPVRVSPFPGPGPTLTSGARLPGYTRGRVGRRVRVATQDLRVRVGQLAPRVDAQLVGEQPSGAVEPVQRLGLTPRPVQGRHQGRGEGFPHGMGDGLGPQHRGRPVVLPQHGVGTRQLLDRRQPGLLQRLRGGLERRAGVRTGECGALPQRQGLLQHEHGVGRAALLPGQHQQFLEPLRIQQCLRRPQYVRVPERGQLDPVRLRVRTHQQGAQPRDMALDDGAGVQWRGVVPQAVGQPRHRYGSVGAQQQRGEQTAALGGAEWQRPGQRVDADCAEQPELHERLPFRG